MTLHEELEQRLQDHDWWAFMSDDPSVDKRAQEDYTEIIKLMRDFPNRTKSIALKNYSVKTF
jgi:hypothetical protein